LISIIIEDDNGCDKCDYDYLILQVKIYLYP